MQIKQGKTKLCSLVFLVIAFQQNHHLLLFLSLVWIFPLNPMSLPSHLLNENNYGIWDLARKICLSQYFLDKTDFVLIKSHFHFYPENQVLAYMETLLLSHLPPILLLFW